MDRILTGTIKSLTVRQEGDRVILLSNGRAVVNLPWDAALALARAIRVQAKRAEEQAKAESIAHDQAILLRLGAPVGLSGDPTILNEARKIAAWDSVLRRYIPPGRAGGIASRKVGRPTVKHRSEEEE